MMKLLSNRVSQTAAGELKIDEMATGTNVAVKSQSMSLNNISC